MLIEWGQRNFVNPPYSTKLKESFVRKAYQESLKGKLCVLLLPVSTSTKLFHEVIYPNAEIRFFKGRIKFIGTNSFGVAVTTIAGMHDSMLVIFRPKNGKDKTSIPAGYVLDLQYDLQIEPEGYYFCDGSEKSRKDDAELFSILGTLFGEGDGKSTFNIPCYPKCLIKRGFNVL